LGLYNIDQNYLHKNCMHYKDGFCTLNQISVNPDGPACPKFTPEKVKRTGEDEGQFLSSLRSNQEYSSQSGHGYALGRMIHGPGRERKRSTNRARGPLGFGGGGGRKRGRRRF